MTSSQHGLYALGYTHATMQGTMGSEAARWSKSRKALLSSDRTLQFACVKSESLVTVDQQSRGEYVLGPCTHRPSSHPSRVHQKAGNRRGPDDGVPGKGG